MLRATSAQPISSQAYMACVGGHRFAFYSQASDSACIIHHAFPAACMRRWFTPSPKCAYFQPEGWRDGSSGRRKAALRMRSAWQLAAQLCEKLLPSSRDTSVTHALQEGYASWSDAGQSPTFVFDRAALCMLCRRRRCRCCRWCSSCRWTCYSCCCSLSTLVTDGALMASPREWHNSQHLTRGGLWHV